MEKDREGLVDGGGVDRGRARTIKLSLKESLIKELKETVYQKNYHSRSKEV